MIGVLLLFVLSLSTYAQIGPTGGASIVPTTANPAGLACTRTSVRLLTPAGTIYTCDSTGHYAAVGSSSGSGSIAYAVGGGAAQAQAATYSPVITLTAGQWACWLPLAANSGSGTTFAPNGLTAHTIVKQAGAALAANDIITTAVACAVYDTAGTQWELQNPQTTSTGSGLPAGSTNDIQTNLGGGLFGGTAGQLQWNPSFPGVALTVTNPTQGNDPNDRRAMSVGCTTNSSTSNPNFSDENCVQITETATNGQALYGGGTNSKKTFIPLLLTGNMYGSGQKTLSGEVLNCTSMSDCFARSQAITFSGGPVAGDEGSAIQDVSTLNQLGSLVKTTQSGAAVRTSCNTTLTQNVTASSTAQTVTVASTTGCAVNDWVVIGQEAPTNTPNEIAVKLTAVSVGVSVTGVFNANYSSGATVTPATVLTVGTTSNFGQDRVLVDLSGTSYSTGTVASISGGGFIGSGTTWTSGMVGGSALVPGCISLAQDTYGAAPFGSGSLVSWYQINSVASNTSLGIYGTSVAGDAAYHGNGVGTGAYNILPCAKVLFFSGTTVVLETNTFTWTNADSLELAMSPYPDVSGFQFQTSVYTPGGTRRAWYDFRNEGPAPYTYGLYMAGNAPVSLSVASGGSAYTNNDVVTIVQSGGSAGQFLVTASGGVVSALRPFAPGTGYHPANGVSVTGGTGTGLTVNILYVGVGGTLLNPAFTTGMYMTGVNIGVQVSDPLTQAAFIAKGDVVNSSPNSPIVCYAFASNNGLGAGTSSGLCANATTSAIYLLTPSGALTFPASTTGNIISTGDTGTVTNSMLAGSIALTKIATQSANTILGNYTAGSAAPTAGAAPSGGTSGCAGSTDAVIYTTSSGWGCHQISGGGLPGGSNTQLQYNNSSAFGGIANVTTDGTHITIDSMVSTTDTFTAASPAVAATSTTGNPISYIASPAIAGNVTNGAAAGGNVNITAGNAARLVSGNAAGGNVNFTSGLGIGTGAPGQFNFNPSGGAAGFSIQTVNGSQTPLLGRQDACCTMYIGYASGYVATMGNATALGWSVTGNTNNFSGTADALWTRRGVANINQGAADAAVPVAQTYSVQGVVAGTSNTAGVDFTIAGSQGTGTGAGGKILFKTALAGTTGSAQNALGTVFTIGTAAQVNGTSTDPTCSAGGDIGKQWIDTTSATTTHFKVCGEVASSPAWVTVF